LAVDRHVSASTQSQALSALVFLYRHVLLSPFEWISDLERAKKPVRLPTVLSRGEVTRVFAQLQGTPKLIASLLYGSGLRLLEACTLRIKDVDLERHELLIRDAKGRKDRRTMIAAHVVPMLRAQLASARTVFEHDFAAGGGYVELPDALTRKFPSAQHDWLWQWVFPAPEPTSTSRPASGGAIIFMRQSYNARSASPRETLASRSARPATASVTASRLTCSNAATTSARSKNSWATRTSARPRSTPMC
jgi:integrase